MAEPLRKIEPTEESQFSQFEELLDQSRAQYRTLFNECPISIWEEDFSEIQKYVEDRKREGVTNIRDYLEKNPSDTAKLVQTVRINDVNKATLNIYKAGSREELEENLKHVFGPKTYDIFLDEVAALAEKQAIFTGTTVNETLTGEEMRINLKMCIVPGYESNWSKILVFITLKND